jgi:hypothetical protein
MISVWVLLSREAGSDSSGVARNRGEDGAPCGVRRAGLERRVELHQQLESPACAARVEMMGGKFFPLLVRRERESLDGQSKRNPTTKGSSQKIKMVEKAPR